MYLITLILTIRLAKVLIIIVSLYSRFKGGICACGSPGGSARSTRVPGDADPRPLLGRVPVLLADFTGSTSPGPTKPGLVLLDESDGICICAPRRGVGCPLRSGGRAPLPPCESHPHFPPALILIICIYLCNM